MFYDLLFNFVTQWKHKQSTLKDESNNSWMSQSCDHEITRL